MKAKDLFSLSTAVVKSLLGAKMTLSVAESCTGGLIGKSITDISGSSSVFYGGFLLYSNEAKVSLAGVSPDTLEAHGAVSEETVKEMAGGTKEKCGTEFALAVSGIAGPGGGTAEKPVGTVWIGLASPEGTFARKFLFEGDRDRVREATVEEALTMLINKIENKLPQ
ncbi:MAG: CinA family protein [Spirochaetales bacterium]|nr:CinA family protein [Spirochaetales bacterium]